MKKPLSIIAVSAFLASPAGELRAAGDLGLKASEAQSAPAVSAPAPLEKAFADSPGVPAHGYTPAERKAMTGHNSSQEKTAAKSLYLKSIEGQYRPYADYEKTGYLIMSSDFNFDSGPAKLELARNLPADATLVIFADRADADTKERVLGAYEQVLPRARIKVVAIPGSSMGFWARDAIPVPVFDNNMKLTVVDAVYGHRFEPDAEIARIFRAGLEKHEFYFEGGNFQANHLGDCLMVNYGAHIRIPDDIFKGLYGCERLIRLPFVDGIGHVDEHARFISEKVIVTDQPRYKDILEGKGFTVHLLPEPEGPYETYANSLIMNGRVIVPVYGRATDEQALDVYRSLGLQATGAPSGALSNRGQGSVHCITMTYPKVPAAELMKALGAREF
ncbi:MAG: agmatine deiminase family protein [Elusimicrobia bacterium]|nr:agmatine deiminase family protein [Elusimicrobiota bacterium]